MIRIHHAKRKDLAAIRGLMLDTFLGKNREPGALTDFSVAYEVCDPDFTPEQYLFRKYRGRITSALKVFVRRLHHPAGPVLVTIIGGVCTREDHRNVAPSASWRMNGNPPAGGLHRKIGKLEMISFDFVTEDAAVQTTRFADGTRIVANVSDEERDAGEFGRLPADSWVALT